MRIQCSTNYHVLEKMINYIYTNCFLHSSDNLKRHSDFSKNYKNIGFMSQNKDPDVVLNAIIIVHCVVASPRHTQ